jgi:hypothetical protein
MSADDLNILGPANFLILGPANFPDQLSAPITCRPTQDRLAVFRDPYDMIFDIIHCMTGFAVVLQTASILKSSPEGECFSPNPRKG